MLDYCPCYCLIVHEDWDNKVNWEIVMLEKFGKENSHGDDSCRIELSSEKVYNINTPVGHAKKGCHNNKMATHALY